MSYSREDASLAYARRLQEEFDRFSLSSPKTVDNDFQLALKLQAIETEEVAPSSSRWGGGVSDEEYARRLQVEGDAAQKSVMSDEEFARMLQRQEENDAITNKSMPSPVYPANSPPLSPFHKGKAPMKSPLPTQAPMARRPLSPPASPPEPPLPKLTTLSPVVDDSDLPAPPPLMRLPTPPEGYVEPTNTGKWFERNDPSIDESLELARQLERSGGYTIVGRVLSFLIVGG
jgi:hypothetical protein